MRDRSAEFAVALAALAMSQTQDGWSETFWLVMSAMFLLVYVIGVVLDFLERRL